MYIQIDSKITWYIKYAITVFQMKICIWIINRDPNWIYSHMPLLVFLQSLLEHLILDWLLHKSKKKTCCESILHLRIEVCYWLINIKLNRRIWYAFQFIGSHNNSSNHYSPFLALKHDLLPFLTVNKRYRDSLGSQLVSNEWPRHFLSFSSWIGAKNRICYPLLLILCWPLTFEDYLSLSQNKFS